MTKEEIKTRCLKILREQVGLENIPDDTKLNEQGLDSLDEVEIIMAAEEEFEIQIPDEDAERITTVKEAFDYINAKLNPDGN